jgi:hypothetical protein
MNRMVRTAVVLVVLGLSVSAPATWAADKCKNPAICQYIEDVPTSKGSRPTNTDSTSTPVTRLSTKVRETIREASTATDAQTLEKIATSAGYGAPETLKVKKQQRNAIQAKVRAAQIDRAKPLPAAFGAVSDGGGGRVLFLVIIMGVMTVAAVAFAGIRRRNAGR